MQKLQFVIEIRASKEKVWNTLWDDKTFREWANIIDEGTYMVGELKERNEVQYISSKNGYGVTSLVEKVVVGEFLLLLHSSDTQDAGKRKREEQWTGGEESYLLAEHGGTTTLTVELDAPSEQIETFKERLPKALNRIKELAEK